MPKSSLNGAKVGSPWLGFGIGLRATHYRQFLEHKPAIDWLEVHTENYLDSGGWDMHVLEQLRQHYPISLHGVGMGLGSARGFSEAHLQRVKKLVNRIQPALVSEHLCWSAVADRQLNDLLPLVLSAEMMALMCQRVDHIQQVLGRAILVENVSTYLRYNDDGMSEAQFLAELAKRTGCFILLDVNNLFVNQCNHKESAEEAIAATPVGRVGEIHLAGHLCTETAVVDHHGAIVAQSVWSLYEAALRRFGPISTLIEWDTDIPALEVLLGEAEKARALANKLLPAARLVLRDTQHGHPPLVSADQGLSNSVGTLVAKLVATDQQKFCNVLMDLRSSDTALPLFKGDKTINEQRLGLYRGNLAVLWERALAAAYPVLKMLVGEEFFAALAREYGRAFPSDNPDLNCFGARFSEFLSTFPHVAQYPYFPDMAKLEWVLHRAHYADNVVPTVAADFVRLTPEQADRAVFKLHSACTLFTSEWAVVALWQAHQEGSEQEFPEQLATPSYGLTIRPNWQTGLLAISPASHAALSVLNNGLTLGAAVDAALAIDANFDVGAQLQEWLAYSVLVSAR